MTVHPTTEFDPKPTEAVAEAPLAAPTFSARDSSARASETTGRHARIAAESRGLPRTAEGAGIIERVRIFSGIRASGNKTLGNYSGGFRQYVATQERGHAFFCVVDLHSITTPFEPEVLREATLSTAALLFATGLDPERSTVFVQSHVRAHAEAAWLLGAVASFGELRRMTQFKERAEEQEFVSAGLFNYPVLMAGDILLYQTDIVPIGDDQRQHLELARTIAERFNSRFGETFKVPEGVYPDEGARVKNLQEPERLMSTTRGAPQGVVRIIDEPDVIRKKIKTAVTDSGTDVRHDPADKPGISNLIEIMAVATGDSIAEIEARYDGQGYGGFKEDVAEAVVELFVPIQQRYEQLRADETELERLLELGADKAREASAPTLEAMYERMGFVRPRP
jgi:tryptophanyl-tRNA synthetase